MKEIYGVLTLLLAFALWLGFARVLKGPNLADNMLASLLLGTTGVALLLISYRLTGQEYLLNISLSFAFLAGVLGVAFAIILLRDAD